MTSIGLIRYNYPLCLEYLRINYMYQDMTWLEFMIDMNNTINFIYEEDIEDE